MQKNIVSFANETGRWLVITIDRGQTCPDELESTGNTSQLSFLCIKLLVQTRQRPDSNGQRLADTIE